MALGAILEEVTVVTREFHVLFVRSIVSLNYHTALLFHCFDQFRPSMNRRVKRHEPRAGVKSISPQVYKDPQQAASHNQHTEPPQFSSSSPAASVR